MKCTSLSRYISEVISHASTPLDGEIKDKDLTLFGR